MPTENRSSNTELISQAAAAIEDLLANGTGAIAAAAWASLPADLRKLTAQPAPQPHPEPIAWMVGTAFWWTKEEAERDAAEVRLPVVTLGPCAGPGDFERLRAELAQSDRAFVKVAQRLVERDALLREMLELIDDGVGRSDAEWALIQKARTTLSVSREPNAPGILPRAHDVDMFQRKS